MNFGIRTGCIFRWALLLGVSLATARAESTEEPRWWSDAVENRLADAGTNRVEMTKALTGVSGGRREGMAFLVQNMPTADLQSLSAAFLVEEVNLAYQAWEQSPWHERVAKELFINDVLPYACLNEEREP